MSRRFLVFGLSLTVAACSENAVAPIRPSLAREELSGEAPKVIVCHRERRDSELEAVAAEALAARVARGDYVAGYVVDPATSASGDGVHFTRISDAIRAARAGRISRSETNAAACRITIDVVAGTFQGSFDANVDPALEQFPYIIDVPDITVRGALRMQADEMDRATGDGRHTEETTVLIPDRAVTFFPTTEAVFLIVSHPGGSAGDGTVIEGFDFQSRNDPLADGGAGILSVGVQRLVVHGNRFETGLSTAADLRATSGRVEHNFGSGLGLNCSLCLAGPGTYVARGNRFLDGKLGAIYVGALTQSFAFSLGADPVTPVEVYQLPTSAAITARVVNNDLRGYRRLPIGFAVRVLALGPSAASIPQAARAILRDNDITKNTFGVIMDAGFPVAGTLSKGDLDVTFRGNRISGNCQSDLLVAFTRHSGAIGVTKNAYLHDSNFRLSLGGDVTWADAWFVHADGLGNSLVVDRQTIAPGSRVAFDPTKVCP